MTQPFIPHTTANSPMSAFVLASLSRLSPEELAILDAAITPEVAYLMTKAFGPEMGALLWPLIVNDGPDGRPAGAASPQSCGCDSQ